MKIKDIKSIKNHEIFIELKGLKYEELNKPFYFPENTKYDMKLLYGDSERTFRQSDKYSFSTYFNRESVFINLGSVKENIEDIVIQFEDEGRYTIGDIVIYARPINMKIDEEIISEKQKTN
ncbi:hypothetical protein GCM10007425_31420 [Lysinibacillus alkalisoli]|uniref:Uncharacterized protein n=1 Tax=Lysinibacillus alkalisoli TaxID=1911548 RepID=A0A917GAP1_9BACI|nr:hypothetical protein [Lysinibacillus alkalisoli]GGG34437.1 hypothetical protein GCM10007425_31420 [Lysinibacillus alkalisoli]